ncbi:MAG: hypothetical protein ACRD1T_03445 [Acidimicrobiia bacterium]
MKIESTEFTPDVFDSFIEQYLTHEREHVKGRLLKVVEEVESMLPAIESRSAAAEEKWSANETLAHMAVSTQFFGWLVHQVAKQEEIQGDIVEMLRMRDVAGSDASQKPSAELAKQLRDSIERTISFAGSVSVDELRNSIKYLSRDMTAEDILRIPLCGHLEEHVEQLREAVAD